jgi:hypothetical protein
MILNAMYFGKSEIYDVIRKVGGTWNHRDSAAKVK